MAAVSMENALQLNAAYWCTCIKTDTIDMAIDTSLQLLHLHNICIDLLRTQTSNNCCHQTPQISMSARLPMEGAIKSALMK